MREGIIRREVRTSRTRNPDDDGENQIDEELTTTSCADQNRKRGKKDSKNQQQAFRAFDGHGECEKVV